ncbi:MAG: hypothetical protein ACYDAN_12990 [Candidatus Limnocylindrales bacterium]
MRSLFSLPEYDRAEIQLVAQVTHDLAISRSPLLQLISHEPVQTMMPSRVSLGDGSVVDTPTFAIAMEFEYGTTAALEGDQAGLIESIDRAADAAAQTMVEAIMGQLSSVLDAAGQTIDADGRQLTNELFLDMLEQIDWQFDDEGNWLRPSLVAAPDLAKRFAEMPPPTDAEVERMNSMHARKREEALARRRTRKLPR